MNILVTGAAGYIGSHILLALADAGHDVVGLDNFLNSDRRVLPRLRHLSRRRFRFVDADMRNQVQLHGVFLRHRPEAVIHLAALKSVPQSLERPLDYFASNISGLINLLNVMKHFRCRRLVFSSSACVYGAPEQVPVHEDSPLAPLNPYGHSKLMGEQMLADLCQSDPRWQVAVLRYFNPIGAHPSGLIGEHPAQAGTNLAPAILQAAQGQREYVMIHGNDYPTTDGTCVRDYLHVCDLAEGHVAALAALEQHGSLTANLGTGSGQTVLQVLRAFEQAAGRAIPYRLGARRPGDAMAIYTSCARARALLGWQTRRSLAEMCEDAWRWSAHNPEGMATPFSPRELAHASNY